MPVKIIWKKDGTPYEVTVSGKTYKVTETRYDGAGVLTGVKTAKHREEWLYVPMRQGKKVLAAPVITDVKNGPHGLAKFVILDGVELQITAVKYALNGDLLEIQISSNHKWGGNWLKIPTEISRRVNNVDRAGWEGKNDKLIADLRRGITPKVDTSEIIFPELIPYSPPKLDDRLPPVAPYNHMGVPKHDSTKTRISTNGVPKYYPKPAYKFVPDDLPTWYEENKTQMKSELETYFKMPDGPQKQSIMKFIDALGSSRKLFLGGGFSSALMDNERPLDRLNMIGQLSPDDSQKVADLMVWLDRNIDDELMPIEQREELTRILTPIFADMDFLRTWINEN